MASLAVLFFVICFCFVKVTPRSIQSDGNIDFELETQGVIEPNSEDSAFENRESVENLEGITVKNIEDILVTNLEGITVENSGVDTVKTFDVNANINSDSKTEENSESNNNNVIWTKLEPIPQQNIQKHKAENISGIKDQEPSSKLDISEENANLLQVETTVNDRERLFLDTESLLDTESPFFNVNENIIFEFSGEDHGDDFETEGNMGELTNSSKDVSELFMQRFEFGNFSSSILNLTSDALGFLFSENSSRTEASTINETNLVGEENEVSPFHDVTTTGFEFLIDSETTQNLLLTELLSSESFLLSEEDPDLNDSEDQDSFLETTNFTLLQDIESGISNFLTGVNESIQFVESFTAQESDTINTENSSENVTEIVPSEVKTNECPPPGWCVFWFLAQDTCAENSHCLGSRICCKSGCSKTCLEVQS